MFTPMLTQCSHLCLQHVHTYVYTMCTPMFTPCSLLVYLKISQTDQIVTLVISSMKQRMLVSFCGPGPTSAVFNPLLSVHKVVAWHSSTKGPLSPAEAIHIIPSKDVKAVV